MDDETAIQITIFVSLALLVVSILIYTEGQRSSRDVCERMLQYEQHMTKEGADKAFQNELEREGR